VLHWSRPVVFYMLYRLRGKESWGPWLASLLMDLVALRCTSLADKTASDVGDFVKQFIAGSNSNNNRHGGAELARRRLLLFFYLLRSPAYETWVGRWMQGMVSASENTPGAKFIAPLIAEQVAYYHKTHFYSSAS
jgi:hypothetical protein